jgi:hypothetical protein
MKYELTQLGLPGNEMIKATQDSGPELWIPQDPGNKDYQAYLAWVAEGNEATVTEQETE